MTAEGLLYPLGRNCCGAPDPSTCHQMGVCLNAGVHPNSTPVHDPGLDHLLEEVAAEVLRQDAAGKELLGTAWMRGVCIKLAARCVRSVRAIDQAAGGEQP